MKISKCRVAIQFSKSSNIIDHVHIEEGNKIIGKLDQLKFPAGLCSNSIKYRLILLFHSANGENLPTSTVHLTKFEKLKVRNSGESTLEVKLDVV